MGNFADAMAGYIQPLINMGDGSEEDLERAFAIGQMCWNLAIVPTEHYDELLDEIQELLSMDDAEFEGFKDEIIFPMIRRHYDMFPKMHALEMPGGSEETFPREIETPATDRDGKHPSISPNAPCPCNSGKKYKRCCGRMS